MMKRICNWSRTRKATFLFLAYAITYIVVQGLVGAQGIPVMGECINDSYLHVFTRINISGETITLDVNDVYCPAGCVTGKGQYGSDCDVADRYCVAQDLTDWSSPFFYGIGAIMMLVGVGVIVDNIIRRGEEKDRAFYNA